MCLLEAGLQDRLPRAGAGSMHLLARAVNPMTTARARGAGLDAVGRPRGNAPEKGWGVSRR
jgi:hypothetical protein